MAIFCILNAMLVFDDFDAWGDAVSGASLRLVCDAVDTGVWTIGAADLGGVTLQMASEGGGNLCVGGNTYDGPLLFVPLTRAADHVVNGESLDDDSLLAIPRGADFRIAVPRRAHAWCSIGLPADAAPDLGTASRRVPCPPGSLPRLRRLVTEIGGLLLDGPTGTAAHLAAGRAVADAARACVPSAATETSRVGRPRLDRTDILRRVMTHLDDALLLPSAAELARHVGVTDRTLLRTFQETFGVPPKRYLMLRSLHAVRRRLRDGADHGETVADVLTRHGVWEFGRFAARYRGHFGESPSETLRRARG
ncbi:MAG: helix-turn-helix domain-containing protein [Planctomycetaceae bacterium]